MQLRQNYNLDAKIGCIIHLQFEIKQVLKTFYFEFMHAFSFSYTWNTLPNLIIKQGGWYFTTNL